VNGALSSIAAVAVLAVSSWTLGTMALRRLAWHTLRSYERLSLRLTAGLGLTALTLSLSAAAGVLSYGVGLSSPLPQLEASSRYE
jgi:hypothetical protein